MRAFRIPAALLVAVVVTGCTDGPTTPLPDVTAPEFSRNNNRASRDRTPPTSDWVVELFIDRGVDPIHGGPGPNPTVESNRFSLTEGRISWPSGGVVKYKITGMQGVGGGNAAVEAGVTTIGGFVLRTFTKDDAAPTTNPCGVPNEVAWAAIDGSGGILGTASVCRNIMTKEIGGFVVTIDTDEMWSVAAAGEAGKFDVQNVITHEFGHVAGLGHVNAPRDGCLTMYKFSNTGETRKRDLGFGDRLGMDVLYNTSVGGSAGAC